MFDSEGGLIYLDLPQLEGKISLKYQTPLTLLHIYQTTLYGFLVTLVPANGWQITDTSNPADGNIDILKINKVIF